MAPADFREYLEQDVHALAGNAAADVQKEAASGGFLIVDAVRGEFRADAVRSVNEPLRIDQSEPLHLSADIESAVKHDRGFLQTVQDVASHRTEPFRTWLAAG